MPKQPNHREDLTLCSTPLPTPKVQQPSARSQECFPATLDQTLVPCHQGTQDASVEARISLDLGKEATTQTDNAPLAEVDEPTATDKAQIDESTSQKTYNERLKSLSNELSDIRLLFERACSK